MPGGYSTKSQLVHLELTHTFTRKPPGILGSVSFPRMEESGIKPLTRSKGENIQGLNLNQPSQDSPEEHAWKALEQAVCKQ